MSRCLSDRQRAPHRYTVQKKNQEVDRKVTFRGERRGKADMASGARCRESSSELWSEVWLLGLAGGVPGQSQEEQGQKVEATALQAKTCRQGGHGGSMLSRV